MKTQVAIIGSGPAGLLLSQLLYRQGIDSVILELRSRAYVEGRIRAGVLEQGTVDVLREAGVSARLEAEGLEHHGVKFALEGELFSVPLTELTGGKSVTVYGQTKVTEDLIARRLSDGGQIIFEATDVEPRGFMAGDAAASPSVTFVHQGERVELSCDFIAGCDGYHGVCRQSLPAGALRSYERTYPFAWLGLLAESPPANEELIYSRHSRGFSLCSMRSRTVSRHYLQCAVDEDIDEWPDERFWEELRKRLAPGAEVEPGRTLEKSITPMRSFVCEPLRHGRLFLAGDAAHIVPPTGAKGLNLACSDVVYLSRALTAWYGQGDEGALERYSGLALARVWKAQRFSWWMTRLLHNFPAEDAFDNRVHQAELEYVLGSRAALTSLAENYVGLPF